MAMNLKSGGHPELSELETAVMNVLWDLGECGSREVIDEYNRRSGRALADTTIRTVLANLRKKGYVEPVPTIERGMRLKPAVGREGVARRNFRQLIAQFFGGSPGQALAYLIKNEPIGDEDIAEIERMLAGLKKGRKGK
jgi:predicted transcriptional regulator